MISKQEEAFVHLVKNIHSWAECSADFEGFVGDLSPQNSFRNSLNNMYKVINKFFLEFWIVSE